MEKKGFGRLGITILLAAILLVVIIILISQRVKEEEILMPEKAEVEVLPVEPEREVIRIEDIEFEEMELAPPSKEASLPEGTEEEHKHLKEVTLEELPLDEVIAQEIEVEEEGAEPLRQKKEEPTKPGHDIHPGPEDLRTLKESGAIIY